MNKPFMFVITAVPDKSNRHFNNVFKALVHIWVMDTNLESAKHRALNDIKKCFWIPQKIEHEFEIKPEQLENLHKAEATLYQKALAYGIAADYIASPIRERSADVPIEVDSPI